MNNQEVWKTLTTMLVTAGITWSATWMAIGTGKADLEDVATNTAKIEALQDQQNAFQLETVRTLGRMEAMLNQLVSASNTPGR